MAQVEPYSIHKHIMNNLVRGVAGLASAGTACTGGYFVCKHYIFTTSSSAEQNILNQSKNSEKKVWKTLDTSTSNYVEGTIGQTYGGNLLDPFDPNNKEKWQENYQKIVDDENKASSDNSHQREITASHFQASIIQNAFSEENNSVTSALNKECKKYYGKQIESEGETDVSKIKIGGDEWKAIWMLCSQWNPIMLGTNLDNYPENSIGKTRGNELLSTQNTDNEELWKNKNKRFFELSAEPTEKMFKELYIENKDKENSLKLKDKCESIYKLILVPEQDSQPKSEDVVKYCSVRVF